MTAQSLYLTARHLYLSEALRAHVTRHLSDAVQGHLAQKRLLHALTDFHERRLTLGRRTRKYSFERLARALGWGASNR